MRRPTAVVRSDGKRYESVADAARDVGTETTNIYACLNSRRKRAGGFGWTYAPGTRARVPVIVDGRLFVGINEAAKWIGASKSYVSRALKNGDGLVKGHVVSYAFRKEVTCPCCNGKGVVAIDEGDDLDE